MLGASIISNQVVSRKSNFPETLLKTVSKSYNTLTEFVFNLDYRFCEAHIFAAHIIVILDICKYESDTALGLLEYDWSGNGFAPYIEEPLTPVLSQRDAFCNA